MTIIKTFQIPLTNSTLCAYVELDDYGLVSTQVWRLAPRRDKLYAVTKINGRQVYMHRFIIGRAAMGKLVDHEDGDGLNNRRSTNLRVCTRSQNMANSRAHKDSKGKYKGVSFEKATGKYVAMICVNRKQRKIGRFDTELAAAKAYNDSAVAAWGEFAKINQL